MMSKGTTSISKLIKEIQSKYKGSRTCINYYGFLWEAKEWDENRILLKWIISYHMRPDDSWEPFHPFMSFEWKRSPIPWDLSKEQIAELEKHYAEISDYELKSRVGDVLWIRTKQIQYAQDAIRWYLESAKELRKDGWTYTMDRIERALRLSISLRKWWLVYRDEIIDYIKSILGWFNHETEKYFHLKLIELLTDVGIDESGLYITTLKTAIKEIELADDLGCLNDYLGCLSKCYRQINDLKNEQLTKIKWAENYVKYADRESSAMWKVHMLQKAIAVYKTIGKQKKRINILHKLLLIHQQKIPDEMQKISTPIDISEMIEKSSEFVSKKTTRDALIHFCLVSTPNNINRELDYLEKQTSQMLHTMIFGSSLINDNGKTVANIKPLSENKNKDRNKTLFPHLVQHLSRIFSFTVKGTILPAKNQITLEHSLSGNDLKEFLSENPFIRPGREKLFEQAILFGFEDKWDLVGNILWPQVEDSLRFVLEQNWLLTSTINDDFTQEEKWINGLFKNHEAELKKIFGNNIFYELKILLIKDEDGNGLNLRNLVAHWVMSYNDFYSAEIIYLWWLIFRLICIPTIKYWK